MAKLYFRYGSMGSAKTLNLLAVAHNYRQQGKKVLLMKPKLEDRFGAFVIKSRAGLEMKADILIDEEMNLLEEDYSEIDCLLIDEVNFVSVETIEQLREISMRDHVPVICYGLRTTFRGELFDPVKRLMEIADSIEEVKTTCHFCNRKATMNIKHVNGKATLDGPTVDLGAEEMYFPACYGCYSEQVKAGQKESALASTS